MVSNLARPRSVGQTLVNSTGTATAVSPIQKWAQ